VGSGANERGRRGDSIPYLTYCGDASWRSNFVEEDATAVCSTCFWAILCVRPAGDESGAVGQGGTGGKCRARRGLGTWARRRGGGTTPWWPVALLAMRTSAGGGAHEAQAGAAGAHGRLQGEAPGHAR
jgi:hypothetical protein